MTSREIEFHAPRELESALRLLQQHEDEVTVLAGGMSLVPMMNLGLAEPERILSLNHLDALDYIIEDDTVLRIAACTRHVRIARDPLVREHCSVLAEAAARIGDVQVRNRGTIGGSVAHADPAADYPPILSLVGAEIRLRTTTDERTIAAGEFFLHAMTTAREPAELIVEIGIPKQGPEIGLGYAKFVRVEGTFGLVNAVARVDRSSGTAGVALGGVGTRPLVVDVSDEMRTEGPDAASARAYDASAEAVGDFAPDADYRREMVRVFARRTLTAAAGGP